jgi:hypothetical protein
MKCLTDVAATILSEPALREIYYEQVKTQRGTSPTVREGSDGALADARANAPTTSATDKSERMKALYDRIGYDPEEHPALDERPADTSDDVDVTADTAATVSDLQRLIVMRRMTKKAARARLREVGIK